MNSNGLAAGSAAGVVSCGCSGGGVRVSDVDVTGLSDEALLARLGVIGRSESTLTAMKAVVLAEIAGRGDTAAAERAAREELGASGRAARNDVHLGVGLSDLDATRDALSKGSIPPAHARLITRAAEEGPIDESLLAEAAQQQGYDAFRRTLRRHQAEQSNDNGASLLERQQRERKGSVFTSAETAMTVLNAQFDPIVGAQIAAVLAAAERRLYRDEDPKDRPSHRQRTADAIAELLLNPHTQHRSGVSLLVVADYDSVNQQLANARLADGTPIPLREALRLACDAEILPAMFRKATGDMCLGRTRRIASDAQRAALAFRDQGCVGCSKSPTYCQAHHIIAWEHGGRTDLNNLALVCNKCHRHIHDDGWQIHHNTTTNQYELHPPNQPHP